METSKAYNIYKFLFIFFRYIYNFKVYIVLKYLKIRILSIFGKGETIKLKYIFIVSMIIGSVLLAGCTSEGGDGSGGYSSSNEQQHHTDLLFDKSYQFTGKHYENKLIDSTYSVPAGDYKIVKINIDTKDTSNYRIYGTMEETTGNDIYFTAVGYMSGISVEHTNSENYVESYSFNINPISEDTIEFYLDNRKSWFTNKLPRLTVYEEYDKYEKYKEIPISIVPKGEDYAVRGTLTVNSGVEGVLFMVLDTKPEDITNNDNNHIIVSNIPSYERNIQLKNNNAYSFEFTPTNGGTYYFLIANKNQEYMDGQKLTEIQLKNPFELSVYEEYDQ